MILHPRLLQLPLSIDIFLCEHCDRAYSRQRYRARHMRKCHPDKVKRY